jgi:uncharacterized protein YoxC
MNELLNTNIFFFITSIAVIVFAIGFVVLLYFLIPLVRDTHDLIAKLASAAKEVEDDYETLKENIEEEGAKTKAIADVVLGFIGRALQVVPPRRRKKKSKRASP